MLWSMSSLLPLTYGKFHFFENNEGQISLSILKAFGAWYMLNAMLAAPLRYSLVCSCYSLDMGWVFNAVKTCSIIWILFM